MPIPEDRLPQFDDEEAAESAAVQEMLDDEDELEFESAESDNADEDVIDFDATEAPDTASFGFGDPAD